MLKYIPRVSGIYLLLILFLDNSKVNIGKFGDLVIRKGLYVYVGSAMGSGGLRARIGRHLKTNKKLKWHIDYILSDKNSRIVGIIFSRTSKKMESDMAECLIKHGFKSIAPYLGATDYRYKKDKNYSHFLSIPIFKDHLETIIRCMHVLDLKPIKILSKSFFNIA